MRAIDREFMNLKNVNTHPERVRKRERKKREKTTDEENERERERQPKINSASCHLLGLGNIGESQKVRRSEVTKDEKRQYNMKKALQ